MSYLRHTLPHTRTPHETRDGWLQRLAANKDEVTLSRKVLVLRPKGSTVLTHSVARQVGKIMLKVLDASKIYISRVIHMLYQVTRAAEKLYICTQVGRGTGES